MKKGTSPTLEVIVATHKIYPMPSDPLYQPLLVGSNLFLKNQKSKNLPKKYLCDNTGENISSKNLNYSELTGLYWLWQNYAKHDQNQDSYYGLVHYRRFLTSRKKSNILTKSELQSLLAKHKTNHEIDIILPKKRHYYIENLYDHYAHTLHIEPLNQTREIIQKKHPELKAFLQSNERMKLAAGQLIELCGLKGYQEGNVKISDQHALILINL